MSYLVLVLLSLLWLGFFLPSLLRSRRSSPYVSATTFKQSLERISTGQVVDAGVAPHHPPQGAARARLSVSRRELARRRDTLMVLAASVPGTAALGLSFGGVMWFLVIPAILAFAGYVAVLRVHVVRAGGRLRHRARRRVPAQRAGGGSLAVDGVVPSVRRRAAAGSEPAPAPGEPELERLAG